MTTERAEAGENEASGLSPETLRQIAMEHKVVMWCIVLLVVPGAFDVLLPLIGAAPGPSVFYTTWMVSWVIVSVASAIVVFSLSRRLANASIAATLALLSFIPVAGLAIMLIVDRKAMSALRGNGYRVGLLGARRVRARAR